MKIVGVSLIFITHLMMLSSLINDTLSVRPPVYNNIVLVVLCYVSWVSRVDQWWNGMLESISGLKCHLVSVERLLRRHTKVWAGCLSTMTWFYIIDYRESHWLLYIPNREQHETTVCL